MVSRRVESRPRFGRLARRKYRAPEAQYVAVSRSVAAGLAASGIPADRIDVIPVGIDLERFRGADPRPTGEEVRFVNVAAMSAEKDQATLLRAFASVESDGTRARLTLAGSGPLERELKALAASLGLRRVTFAGWREDVPTLLAEGDAFVLTSRREGLGSSIMEAMAAGLPVMATRAGGIPEAAPRRRDRPARPTRRRLGSRGCDAAARRPGGRAAGLRAPPDVAADLQEQHSEIAG